MLEVSNLFFMYLKLRLVKKNDFENKIEASAIHIEIVEIDFKTANLPILFNIIKNIIQYKQVLFHLEYQGRSVLYADYTKIPR